MEKNKLMNINIGDINEVDTSLYHLEQLINIIIYIKDYHSCIEFIIENYSINLEWLSDYAYIKRKLSTIIEKLSNLGFTYEDIAHTYNTYIIMDNYTWIDTCDNSYILQVAKHAILRPDEIFFRKLFMSSFNFLLQNSKGINKRYVDLHLQHIASKAKREGICKRRLRSLFKRAGRIYINN